MLIAVDKLEEGQVLAREVTRGDGVALVNAGQELTPELIAKLRELGLGMVEVEGELFASEEERLAFIEESLAELDRRFSRVEDSPETMAVKGLFKKKFLERYGPYQG